MKRERSRTHVALTVERPSERMGDNVRPLPARTRRRRVPSTGWDGLESFLAVLPHVFAPREAGARATATGRGRVTFGDDAA
jgi:hypothetical protein